MPFFGDMLVPWSVTQFFGMSKTPVEPSTNVEMAHRMFDGNGGVFDSLIRNCYNVYERGEYMSYAAGETILPKCGDKVQITPHSSRSIQLASFK